MSQEQTRALDSQEIDQLHHHASSIESELRESFDDAFQAWQAEWFTGPAAMSSDTRANRELPSYQPLLDLGPAVLPLVAHELRVEKNFPALVLYDDLAVTGALSKSVQTGFATDGEQSRARRTLREFLGHMK